MIPSIRTSYASLADLPTRYAGAADHWLSPSERQAWRRMRSAQRRTTWLAGRIVAKRLLIDHLAATGAQRVPRIPAEIDIASAGGGKGQRPSVSVWGRSLDIALSIAHTDRGVLVAMADARAITLGVDLVGPQDRQPLAWCFTPAEQRWLVCGTAHRRAAEQIWAMKEALYKACQQGEGFAPRQIEITPGADPVYPMLSPHRAIRSLQAWRVDGQFAALAIVEPSGVQCEAKPVGTDAPCELNPCGSYC